MRGRNGYVEVLGALVPVVLAAAIGWWGLTQFAVSEPTGLAALGFASFLLAPAAWLGAKLYGVAITGSAGCVMIVIAVVIGTFH